MTTLQKIADLTGVSKSTVSKALRNSSDINEQTAEHIRKTAYALGYNTERLHGHISGSQTIGVVFPELKSLYYNKIYDIFCKKIEAEGFRVITTLYNFDTVDKQIDAVHFMLKQNVSGILFLSESIFDIEKLRVLFKTTQTKLVMITLNNLINFCDTISTNNSLGVQMAVNHLYSLGHRKIAFIGEPNTQYRKKEFISVMRDYNIPLDERYIVEIDARFEECGYLGMKKLLELDDFPTACFAAYDNIAYGAMKALHEAGKSIPKDISIIGVDNNPISKFTVPSLSSINSPETDIGNTAAEFMIERIHGIRTSFRSILICPTLYKRESTASVTSESDSETQA